MTEKHQTKCPHCGVKFLISAQQLSAAGGNVRCGSCLQVFQAGQNLVSTSGSASATPSARSNPAPSARGLQPPPTARPGAASPSPAGPSRQPAAGTPPANSAHGGNVPAAPPAGAAVRPPAPPPTPRTDDLLASLFEEDFDDFELPESLQSAAPVPKPPVPPPSPKPVAKAAPAAPPPRPIAPSVPPPPADDDDPFSHDVDEDLADMILREAEENPAALVPPPAPPPAEQPPSAGVMDLGWNPNARITPRAGSPASEPPPPPSPRNSAERYGIEENKIQFRIAIDDDDSSVSRIEQGADPFGVSDKTYKTHIEEPVNEDWAKELLGEKEEDEREKRVRQFREVTADKLSLTEQTGVQARRTPAKSGATTEGKNPPARQAPVTEEGIEDELDFLSDGDSNLRMHDVELPGMDHEGELAEIPLSHQVKWGGEVFWGALSAVMLLVLLGQYLYFNADSLARDDNWRGLYAVFCGAAGCTLPDESDVSRIQGANLVIRSHPQIANALMVDAIVYNRAPFFQPFPRMELVFSDRTGSTVAARVFEPAEYLKGELSVEDWMPPDTPVHLSLELVDPGAEAVNYEIRFLAPAA